MDNSTIRPLMTYYKNCYQADNRALQVYNFSGSQVETRQWLADAALLEYTNRPIPVDSNWGEKVFQRLLLNQKEETLLLGAFFLIGKARIGFDKSKAQKVCAPLLLIPVELILEEGIYYLELKEEPNVLNPAIVRLLDQAKSTDKSTDNFSSNYDLLADKMPYGAVDFDALFHMEKGFKQYYPNLNLDLFNQFPQLLNEKSINKHFRSIKSENEFQLVPGLAAGIIQKSKAARGVIDELEALSHSKELSAPLQALFGLKEPRVDPWKKDRIIYNAANLSLAQQNALIAANQYALSQITGPPGTGKSFTIATIAIDAACRRKSVLIVAKHDQAADVIAKKIKQDLNLPNLVVRSGKSRVYKKALKNKLQNLINGIHSHYIREIDAQGVKHHIIQTEKERKKLEDILLKREENELLDSQFLQNASTNLLQIVKRFFIERKIQKTLPYWEVVRTWEKNTSTKVALVKRFAKVFFHWKLQSALSQHRQTFVSLLNELKQRRKDHKNDFTQVANYELLFEALPIWITTTSEVSQLIPNQAELFDLVIVDEASQCDIASALPVLQRGKKAVVVGDPKQLRHLSFLSKKRQRALQAQYELHRWQGHPVLDYRSKSLLDSINYAIENQDQIHFLNEHYRSEPDIIHFSNHTFYGAALNVMKMHPHNVSNRNIELHICAGQRNAQGYNEIEAMELFKQLEKIAADKPDQTIGILSPFRAQVDYLKKQLVKQFSISFIQDHQILVGTPYHFQGEEKDIMLLSMAIDDDAHASTFRYLNRADVFNVSITRAKTGQHIFLSGDANKWSKDFLLAQYLDSIVRNRRGQNKTPDQLIDQFAEELEAALAERGYTNVQHRIQIAGFEVDLAIIQKDRTLAIDLVGFPGAMQRAFPPDKHQMLRRIGIPVFVLPHAKWLVNPASCLAELKIFLDNPKRKITNF